MRMETAKAQGIQASAQNSPAGQRSDQQEDHYQAKAISVKGIQSAAPCAAVYIRGSALLSCKSQEVCDWEDNDRDGWIDEGFDQDNDGVWASGLTADLYAAGDQA